MVDPYTEPQKLFTFFDNAELKDLELSLAVMRRQYFCPRRQFAEYDNLVRNRDNCTIAIQYCNRLYNQYELLDDKEPLKWALRAGRFIVPFADPDWARYHR